MAGKGQLVVISGPSGVGKTTICDELIKFPGMHRLVTCTTRAPREGERDGIDYHFLPREEFERRIARGDFLEYAEVHGHLYGTPRVPALDAMARGETVILNIDVQGARTIRDSGIRETISFFVEPPDMEELIRRLEKRGTEFGKDRAQRMVTAQSELEHRSRFDHLVTNDDLKQAVQTILRTLRAKCGSKSGVGSSE